MWLKLYFHENPTAAMAPKLSNLLSTVAVTKILEMKLCAFMRNGQFLRKSIFFITKQTWLRGKKHG